MFFFSSITMAYFILEYILFVLQSDTLNESG